MNRKSKVVLPLFCVVTMLMIVPLSVVGTAKEYPIYRNGGASTKSQFYWNRPGWPPYQKRPLYIGVIKGSWYEMGVQYGERGGKWIRWVFDARWERLVERYGVDTVLEDLQKYYDQAELFSPQLIDFMMGIADGATKELKKSIHADACSNLMKIMVHNCYSDFYYGHPGGGALESMECTAMVVFGGATKNGEMIVAHSRDEPFGPHMLNDIAYVAIPDDPNANMFFAVGVAGTMTYTSVNDKGLQLSQNAGGWLGHKDYGVPWEFLNLYTIAYADNVDEAMDIYAHGSPEYKANTGRTTVLRTIPLLVTMGDGEKAAVFEYMSDRYAVRYPGDVGEDDFLVIPNHYKGDKGSYNEDDVWEPEEPMTKYGHEDDTASWAYPNSKYRYYTLWWLIKQNYGKIDAKMVKDFYKSHFYINEDGTRVDYVWNDEWDVWVPSYLMGYSPCRHGGIEYADGIYTETYRSGAADVKVAVLKDHPETYFIFGRADEWKGPWSLVIL